MEKEHLIWKIKNLEEQIEFYKRISEMNEEIIQLQKETISNYEKILKIKKAF